MKPRSGLIAAALFASGPALAHTGVGSVSSLGAGFAHPFLGLDHVLAMGAVGLWASLVGGRALWAWPLAFIALVTGGAGLGAAGVPLPAVELMIAASVL